MQLRLGSGQCLVLGYVWQFFERVSEVLMLMWTENANANALTFQLVEYFSGKGRVSRVFRKAKKNGGQLRTENISGYGLQFAGRLSVSVAALAPSYCWKTSRNNLLHLRLALLLAMKSVPGCLHLCAPVCSSWTRISRGTSWRTAINVFGDLTSEWVVGANLMISRTHGWF